MDQLGKKLTYFLRHSPPCAIDESGYVEIADILPHMSIDDATLRKVVDTDSKTRFAIDETRIRACQGHSIKLESPILSQIVHADECLFAAHATTPEAWLLIKQSGWLSPMSRSHVHFATDPSHMRKRSVVLILNVPLALEKGLPLFRSTNGVVLCPVPVPLDLVSLRS